MFGGNLRGDALRFSSHLFLQWTALNGDVDVNAARTGRHKEEFTGYTILVALHHHGTVFKWHSRTGEIFR